MKPQCSPPEDALDDDDFSETAGLQTAEAAAPTGLNDDGLTGSLGNKEEDQSGRVIQTEEDCEKGADLMKNDHVSEGFVASRTLNKPEDSVNVTCQKMEESTELALGCSTTNGGFVNPSVQRLPDLPEAREKREKGMLLRLDSGYFNDDRSHWDLNSPMDSWKKQPGVLDADTGMDLTDKIAAGGSYKRSLENLDGIQVDTLDVEPERKIRKAEQDMLGMGFQADQSGHGGTASENNTELDTSFGLQGDMLLGGPWATRKNPMKCARVSKKDVQLQESASERGLNLCIASSERRCYSANDVSSLQTEDEELKGEKLPDQDLQSDKQLDRPAIGSEIYVCDDIESYSALKHDVEQVNDNLHAIDGRSAKEISGGLQRANDHLNAVVKGTVSSQVKDQHLVEIMDENRVFRGANTFAICKVDGLVSVEDANTARENPANPGGRLDKLSREHTMDSAYASGSKHEDEDEPVSNTNRLLGGQMDNGFQAEGKGHREAETCDWIQEDAGEEMEVERVDYDDANCRNVDDLGIDPGKRGKKVDCMDTKDAQH